MERTIVMIDGNYLRIEARKLKLEYFDHLKFVNDLLSKISKETNRIYKLIRVYYYDAPPLLDPKKLNEREIDFARKRQRFLDKLDQLPYFEVKLGRIQYKGRDKNGRLITTQKGVDVKMAIDLIAFADQRIADVIVLITGDSDLIPAIRVAKNKGINILLCTFFVKQPSLVNELVKSADFHFLLRSDLFTLYK